MVTIPPEVVRIRASSTVFVKASSLVNLDFAGIVAVVGYLRLEVAKGEDSVTAEKAIRSEGDVKEAKNAVAP